MMAACEESGECSPQLQSRLSLQPQSPLRSQPQSQPQPKPQSPLQGGASEMDSVPTRYQVHHSYIWLGGMRVAFLVLFAAACSSVSAVPSLLAADSMPLLAGISVLAFVVLCTVVAFLAVLGATMLVRSVAYRHLWYELGEEEFSLYSGIFNKKCVHVPYRRVQSVDQRSSLLQRVFGVCTVSIGTAGGASNKATFVPYVRRSQAEELRRELFLRKQLQESARSGVDARKVAPAPASASVPAPALAPTSAPASASAPSLVRGAFLAQRSGGNVFDAPAEMWDDVRGVFAGEYVDTGAISYSYGLSNKELLLTGLSNNTAFVLVVLGELAAIVQFVGDIAPLVAGVARPVVGNAIYSGSRLFGESLVALGVAAIVGTALVVWLFSIVGNCLFYGGFQARRRNNRIEVEHGLLQHSFQGIDVDRVQSVTVRQSFVRRLMGYCEISVGKIDAASQNAGDQQKSGLGTQGVVIHPFVKMARVPEILAGVIPEFADVPTEVHPLPRVGLRRALVRRAVLQGPGFWLAVCATVVFVVFGALLSPSRSADPFSAALLDSFPAAAATAYTVSAMLFALDCVGAVLWFRESSFAFNKRFMQVSNGGFSRETTSFPRGKIQYGWTRTNPFQRRAHTATVCVRTATGVGGTTLRLIDACEKDACMWLNWLKPHRLPHGNVVE